MTAALQSFVVTLRTSQRSQMVQTVNDCRNAEQALKKAFDLYHRTVYSRQTWYPVYAHPVTAGI